jgi:SAM-dependent methyltransferase
MSTPWSKLGSTFLSEGAWSVGQGPDAPDRKLFRQLVRKFAIWPENNVLEIGCGPGIELAGLELDRLLDEINYTGYDFTPELISLCQSNFPKQRFCVRDIQEMSEQDVADIVWCRHVLEHVADGEKALRNLYAAAREIAAVSWFIRPTWRESEVRCVEAEGFLHQTYSARSMLAVTRDLGAHLYRFDLDHHSVFGSVWLLCRSPRPDVAEEVHAFLASHEFLDTLLPVPPDPRERERMLLRIVDDAAASLKAITDLFARMSGESLNGLAAAALMHARSTQARCQAALKEDDD